MAGFKLVRHYEASTAPGGTGGRSALTEAQARVSEWAHGGGRQQPGGEEGGDPAVRHLEDDERSVAADSWSVKSEYGSTLDGGEDTRAAEVMEVMETVEDRAADNDSSEDEEEQQQQQQQVEREAKEEEEEEEEEEEGSVLGLRSHWDATYAQELVNFHAHGQAGEIWFGESVMDTAARWTAKLAADTAAAVPPTSSSGGAGPPPPPGAGAPAPGGAGASCLAGEAATWRVLDLGTGNGMMLHALAKHGFRNLTGTDYSEAAVELARGLALKAGLPTLHFTVDDILATKLEGSFQLVTDKGTLDAVRLHPQGRDRKKLYKKTVERLVAPGGLLVITSCNSTKEELILEMIGHSGPSSSSSGRPEVNGKASESTSSAAAPAASSRAHASSEASAFEFVGFVPTYPTYRFGGVEGTRVCTVAFSKRGRTSS